MCSAKFWKAIDCKPVFRQFSICLLLKSILNCATKTKGPSLELQHDWHNPKKETGQSRLALWNFSSKALLALPSLAACVPLKAKTAWRLLWFVSLTSGRWKPDEVRTGRLWRWHACIGDLEKGQNRRQCDWLPAVQDRNRGYSEGHVRGTQRAHLKLALC